MMLEQKSFASALQVGKHLMLLSSTKMLQKRSLQFRKIDVPRQCSASRNDL
jgi:hypothetical protein